MGFKTADPSCTSTMEAEYISLSMSLWDVIPIMQLLEEMKGCGFQVICTKPHVNCKVFEDNSGALEMAHLPKLCLRTKHINVCYHHFCEHVPKGLIEIFPINTKNQIADALTKPLAQNSFWQHRQYMCGQWWLIAITIVRECCDINNLPPRPQLSCFCKLQHQSNFSFMWLISKNWQTWDWPVRKIMGLIFTSFICFLHLIFDYF